MRENDDEEGEEKMGRLGAGEAGWWSCGWPVSILQGGIVRINLTNESLMPILFQAKPLWGVFRLSWEEQFLTKSSYE